jgi:hypothetical protein
MTLAFPTFLELLGYTETLGEEDDAGCPHGHGCSSVLHGEDIAVSWCMFLKLRKWRGMIRSQTTFNTKLLAGPRKFRYNKMTTPAFHDGREWVPTWPWLQLRFACVRISGVSGRFNDNCLGLGSRTLWRSKRQKLMALGHASRGNGCQKTLYMVIGGNGSWSFWKVQGYLFYEWVFDRGRNVFVPTSLLDMYAKCGTIEQARFVFNWMVETHIVPWSAMIHNFTLNALPKEALAFFF